MKILCVDTSTRNNCIGLYSDGRVTDYVAYVDRQSCLVNLIPSIELLLKNARTDLQSLDAIATIVGPGAWSSLRIGLATVKTLCLVNQLPVIPVNSLDLIADIVLSTSCDKDHIYVAINAQNNKVYGALYEAAKGTKLRISPYHWEDVDTVNSYLRQASHNLLIVGDGAELFENFLQSGWETLKLIPQDDSKYLSTLGEIAAKSGLIYQPDQVMLLKPLYIQPSSAEVQFNVSVTQDVDSGN